MEGESVAVDPPAPPSTLRSHPLLHYKQLSLGVQTKKARFTCVHASENFIACGASNGSVFLFVTSAARADSAPDVAKRVFPAKYHLVKTITPSGSNNDRASVSCLSVCPLQKRLVVGTVGGMVYGVQLTDYNKIGEKVEFSHDFHSGFPVTCFVWKRLGMKLYSACNGGMVAMTTLRAGMSAFFGKTDTELLLKEDSGIVQLDTTKYGKADILMVSSQMRVLLLNLSSADGSAVQIGTKTRQGNFGACFFTSAAVDEVEIAKKTNVKVFSSRPGRRVWVADPQTGTVSATLKFSVGKTPSKFLQDPGCQSEEGVQARDLTINKLALYQFINDPYATTQDRSLLVSWNVGSSVLFFIDPIAVEIVEWHLDLGTIHDLKVLDESVLVVLHGEPPKVSVIQSCSARQFLDIYAGDDVKKAIEMAIAYQITDAIVLAGLKNQWSKQVDQKDETVASMMAKFEALHKNAKELEKRCRVPDLESPASVAATPLQVIFKQRPQPQNQEPLPAQESRTGRPDQFASGSLAFSKPSPGKPTEYADLRTSNMSYRRNIYTPDGSTLEARLIDIKELASTEPIIEPDFRDAWMEDVLEDVRKFEAMKAETDGAMNNLLPTIRGTLNNTGAAAKAITTYIPGANVISTIVDTAVNINYTGRGSAVNMFGEFPDVDAILMDPVALEKPTRLTDAHEYAVLRIAMSSMEGIESNNVDTEVLLEAISMDIWDSKLKYISNLPLEQQLNLPEAKEEDDDETIKKNPYSPRRIKQSKRMSRPSETVAAGPAIGGSTSPLHKSRSADGLQIDPTALADESTSDVASTRRLQRLNRRSSLSPVAGRSAQRAVQRLIGGGPSCDFERKCLVSGQLASSPELENILKREVNDLLSELYAAATTAEKTTRLTRRLWPAAGITRVCACLVNMYLLEGDLVHAQKAIRAWLMCFDPTAKPEEVAQRSPIARKQKETTKNGAKPPTGFTRGEALIDGDGLPLTRNDWALVRVMVSIYFTISAAWPALRLRLANSADLTSDGRVRPYAYEMGIILEVSQNADQDPRFPPWSVKDSEEFIKKYGIYLNTELAAEICNKQRLGTALNAVLDQVVSSSNMSSTCDDVVNWIVEKQVGKALECLKDMDSLCLVLHVLDLLLKKCPNEAVELCVDKYPALSPWNIERCLFGAPQTSAELLKRENVPQTATYYRFLVRLLEEHPRMAGHDVSLVDRCLQLSFAGAKIVGKTFENKHTRHDDVSALVCAIIKQPEVYSYNASHAWDLCAKNHVDQGLLELTLQSLKERSSGTTSEKCLSHMVKVITKEKNLVLLNELLTRASLLSEDTAKHVTNSVLGHIETIAQSGSDDELITTVVHSLLIAVGPINGMDMLAQYPLLFAASPLSMYQTIVEASLLDLLQGNEVNSMLEAVDTQVWLTYKRALASNTVAFAPQIQAVFDMERKGLRPPVDQAKFDKWTTKQSKYEAESHQQSASSTVDSTTLSITNLRPVSRGFEYRSSDWGGDVQLHDAACAMCDLPVVIIADHNSNMEVALLPCGHAFHAACISDVACPVCFDASFESVRY